MRTVAGKVAALLLTASLSCLPHQYVHAVEVGDEVCITGYIMDNWCLFETRTIDGEHTLLDDRNTITLQYPENHSFHCLLDVDVCYESGFQVLGEKDPETDRHCLGFRLDNTNAVLEAGRVYGQDGYCSTCDGDDSSPEYGYRATVRGIVQELGDGTMSETGPPLLTNIEVLDESVACENPTIPPMCVRSSNVVEPVPTPSPTPVPTDEPSTAAPTDTTKAPVAPPLTCPDTLDKSTEIDSLSTFHYALVPSDPPESGNGILCGRIEAENDGWVAFAISRDGMMIGSEAVIGIPGDGSTVLKYDLNGKSSSLVTAMPNNKQTLRDTSIVQQNGQTIMEFTKLLVEDGEIPIVEGDNIFLHARGGSSLGYHSNGRTAFNVDLSTSPAPTDPPSTSPVIAPSTPPSMPPITMSPSLSPAKSPTTSPLPQPSTSPQATLTKNPTGSPSIGSTAAVTTDPTNEPTDPPSNSPNMTPSVSPIMQTTSNAPTLAPLPSSTTNTTAPSFANMTTTLPPAPDPTTSPESMPSVSPVAVPTASPVAKENLPEFTEPPIQSGGKSVGVGLVYFLSAGISLALSDFFA